MYGNVKRAKRPDGTYYKTYFSWIQKKYGEIVRETINKEHIIIGENQKLKKDRDFFLPLLMNGQVTFKD